MKQAKLGKPFVLNDFLPYLVNRAGVKTGLVFGQDLCAFNITLAEWRILFALWENANLRLNDVADIIVADLSTTSRQVRALERAGLVGRAKSSTDRRALDLVLTASGRELTARIIPIAQMHEHAATQSLTEAELAVLRRLLTTIFDNLAAFEKDRGEQPVGARQPGEARPRLPHAAGRKPPSTQARGRSTSGTDVAAG